MTNERQICRFANCHLNRPETRKLWAASKKLQNWTKLKKQVRENSYSRKSFLYFTVMIALSSVNICDNVITKMFNKI